MSNHNDSANQKWIFFFPVYGLEVGADIGGEIWVENILFIRAEKIPRVRKRLGLRRQVSEYNTKYHLDERKLFTGAPTYAVLYSTRTSNKKTLNRDVWKEYGRARDAFHILCSSLLSARNRERMSRPSMRPPHDSDHTEHFAAFSTESDQASIGFRHHAPILAQELDLRWKNDPIAESFFKLLPILSGKARVAAGWKKSLRRAAILGGQSYLATSPQMAFTYNMIGIECLLAQRGERFPDVLVDRLVALFGWLHDEDRSRWESIVHRLYRLRCSYVHDGEHGDLTGLDLFNSDMILSNLILNLSSHSRHIGSKEEMIRYVRELEARKELGRKIRLAKYRWTFPNRVLFAKDKAKLEEFDRWAD